MTRFLAIFTVNSNSRTFLFQNILGIRRNFCLFTQQNLLKLSRPLIRPLQPSMTHSTSSKSSRLADSTSPYLRQHAGNPVDWYPWGVEALEAARSQNKPIFLSIGYSTCHWCHVMAHESFEEYST